MFCSKCGAEVKDDDLFCPKCGHKLNHSEPKEEVKTEVIDPKAKKKRDDSICYVAFVFCVINCVTFGFALIPLIWMLPMTIALYNKIKNHEEISVGFKVCIILFLSLIGGIILLVADENE